MSVVYKNMQITEVEDDSTKEMSVPTYLPDLQRWHMWKKVVSNKKTKKDEIIHYPLKINVKWRTANCQIIFQILS